MNRTVIIKNADDLQNTSNVETSDHNTNTKRPYSGTDAFASDIEFYRTNSKESLFDAALADRNYAGEYSCKTKAYTNCDSQSKKHLITSCHFRFICLSIVRFSCCDYIIPRICALFNGQYNHVLLSKQQMCSVVSHKRHSRKNCCRKRALEHFAQAFPGRKTKNDTPYISQPRV